MKLSFFRQRSQTLAGGEGEPRQNRVFHAREAGLVTGWYLAQRCEEECYRAERYRRHLALLIAEPEPGADETDIQQQMRTWVSTGIRMADIAAYLGGARYAILLPETGRAKVSRLADRLCASVPQMRAAFVTFPRDGRNFSELVASAKQMLDDVVTPASERLAA